MGSNSGRIVVSRENVRRAAGAAVVLGMLGTATLQLPAAPRRNDAPSVSVTAPTKGQVFTSPLNLTISATASDSDGTVAVVQFYQGGTKLGEDTTAPYSYIWAGVPAGSYSLTAWAIDNLGASKKSKPVGITVTGGDPRASTGEWSSVLPWPDVGIHLHLLPTGHVLTWADDDDAAYPPVRKADKTRAYVVTDVDTGANVEIKNESTNLFCSGHAFLPDGRLLILGGHEGTDGNGSIDTNIFDYTKNAYGSWEKTGDMVSGRWYPTGLTLANGDVVAVSGTGPGTPELPEVWHAGVWRTLTTAGRPLYYYPFLHLAPNGTAFVAGPAPDTHYLNTSGTGSWTAVGNRTFAGIRDYGSSVLYGDGKVLVVGGSDPPTRSAEVIDLTAASPTWRSVASMAFARRQLNSTLLADGSVLVTGGTSASGFNNAAGAVFAAELWNPTTEAWSTMASMQIRRLYHSAALLLPDGRVLSAGGGRPWATGEPEGTEHRDAEIFSPPYLFKGARPTIESAPAQVGYGQTFFVDTPNASQISSVTWIRLSSVTHAFNMNQRINRLAFAPSPTGVGLDVTAPASPTICPPGHYMLFVINGNGAPSVAKIVQIV